MVLTSVESGLAQFNPSCTEQVILTDYQFARGWFIINNNQTVTWGNINNNQSITWTNVNDTQNPNWVNINDNQ